MAQHLLCSDGLTDGEIPGDEKSEDTVMNEILKPYGVKGDGSDAEEVGNDAEEVMGNSEVADESNKAEELEEWLLLLEERAVTIAVQPVQPLRLRILGKVPDESNIEKEVEEWLQLMDEEVTAPVRIRIAEKHLYQSSGETDEVKRYKIEVESSEIDSGGGADRAAESKISDAGAEVIDADEENKMGTGGGAVTQAVGMRYPQGGAVCTCMRRKRLACGTLKGCCFA